MKVMPRQHTGSRGTVVSAQGFWGGFLMFRWQLKDEGELARSKASMDVFWRERTEVEGV